MLRSACSRPARRFALAASSVDAELAVARRGFGPCPARAAVSWALLAVGAARCCRPSAASSVLPAAFAAVEAAVFAGRAARRGDLAVARVFCRAARSWAVEAEWEARD